MYNKVTKVDLCGESWEIRILPRIVSKGKYKSVGVSRDRRIVFVASKDLKGKDLPEEKIKEILAKALVPIVIDIKKKQDGIQ